MSRKKKQRNEESGESNIEVKGVTVGLQET